MILFELGEIWFPLGSQSVEIGNEVIRKIFEFNIKIFQSYLSIGIIYQVNRYLIFQVVHLKLIGKNYKETNIDVIEQSKNQYLLYYVNNRFSLDLPFYLSLMEEPNEMKFSCSVLN